MNIKIENLDEQSKITYIEQYLSDFEIEELTKELKTKVPWTFGVYNMFGKLIKTPRKLFAMKDKNKEITNSYKVTDSIEFTPNVKLLKDRIEKTIGTSISYAQLNYYRDGNDYIGFHTDKEVVDGDCIASISLGSSRIFKFHKIGNKKIKHELVLKNGSLLIMNHHSAKLNWKHCLPKMKNVEERINITFRPR